MAQNTSSGGLDMVITHGLAGPIWYLAARLSMDPFDVGLVYGATPSDWLVVSLLGEELLGYGTRQRRSIICLLTLIGRQIGFRREDATPLALVTRSWSHAKIAPNKYRADDLPVDVEREEREGLGTFLRLPSPGAPTVRRATRRPSRRRGPESAQAIRRWRETVEATAALARSARDLKDDRRPAGSGRSTA